MKERIAVGVLLIGCSAFAGPITYEALLTGPGESPPNASPATGFAVVSIDTTANILNIISVTFSGLLGTTTASHIHCCTAAPRVGTAGVATAVPTFPGFPLGVTSGSYSQTFDDTMASTWNAAFITANGGTPLTAEAALAAGLAAGEAYLNIHTTLFPGGEIRGFLAPVPEPGTLAFAGAALAALVLIRRRR